MKQNPHALMPRKRTCDSQDKKHAKQHGDEERANRAFALLSGLESGDAAEVSEANDLVVGMSS